jgi:hypothetical protein
LAPVPSSESLREVRDPVKRHELVDERLKLQNDIRTTLLQAAGGAVLLLGVYLTFRQLQLNQEGHITDRFSHAIDQLGNEQLQVRVGGIAALGRIARDSAKDREPVMESLAAFVREESSKKKPAASGTSRLSGDLQAAATVLGYRPASRESKRINLRDASLARVHLRKAHYERMALTNADFRKGQLTGIYLNHALLRGARFEHAALEEAHFSGAFLVGADLSNARLTKANFNEAWVFGANFKEAYRANLSGSYCDPQPILSWLREILGGSPWEWASLRKLLETPGDPALSALQKKLSPSVSRKIDVHQAQEGLRQIRSLLEKKLTVPKEGEKPDGQVPKVRAVSEKDKISDGQLAKVLQVQDFIPDEAAASGDSPN